LDPGADPELDDEIVDVDRGRDREPVIVAAVGQVVGREVDVVGGGVDDLDHLPRVRGQHDLGQEERRAGRQPAVDQVPAVAAVAGDRIAERQQALATGHQTERAETGYPGYARPRLHRSMVAERPAGPRRGVRQGPAGVSDLASRGAGQESPAGAGCRRVAGVTAWAGCDRIEWGVIQALEDT